jgi:hypothetical protein
MNQHWIVQRNSQASDSHVDNHVHTLGEVDHCLYIADICLLYVNRRVSPMMVKILPLSSGKVINDHDIILGSHKLIDNVATNKASTACHNDSLVSQSHGIMTPLPPLRSIVCCQVLPQNLTQVVPVPRF